MDVCLEPPEGCEEIPGFILVIEEEKLWFTQYGEVTDIFAKRGVWETENDANDARDRFTVDT